MSTIASRIPDPGELAEASVEVLGADPRCEGVLLFGSAARRQDEEHSDLDLLVLYRDEVPEQALDRLHPRVSVSFYGEERLRALPRRSPLFAIHLAREGCALYDPRGTLDEALRAVGPLSDSDVASLVQATRRRLRGVFADPEYAPDDKISAGELYALAMQAALLLSARRGNFQFNRKRAFQELGESNRELRADLARVALLEPAWLAARPTYEIAQPALEAISGDVVSSAVRVDCS